MIWYCNKHDTHTDLDWHSEGCPECEREEIEKEEAAQPKEEPEP